MVLWYYLIMRNSYINYPEEEAGFMWNDPAIGIEWPEIDAEIILSEKDSKYAPFSK